METQIERAGKMVLEDTNVRILSHKEIDFCYGVYINTICKDLKNDTPQMRIDLLLVLRDFNKNISYDIMKYLKGDNKYEASISMRLHVSRLATKICQNHNKNSSLFTDIKVRCVIENCRHLIELKEYILIESKK